MKEIKIKSLRMYQFRGATTIVNFSQNTTIRGWNGSGKSRNIDAFRWCLFGKDSQDRKDYEIKTRVNGKTQPKADAEVEVVLDVDGVQVTFRRTLREQWVKPRGQEQEVFKGNATICAVDDVPMRVSDYDNRVAEIINDDMFKILTDPTFFCSMPWKDQRGALFAMCGKVSDEEIIAGNDEYPELMQRIAGKSVSDYGKVIAAAKAKSKKALAEIQPRIAENYAAIPQEEDWSELERQLAEYDAEIEALTADKKSDDERRDEKKRRIAEIEGEIADLKLKQRKIVNEAVLREDAEIHHAEKEYMEVINAQEVARSKCRFAQTAVDDCKRKQEQIEQRIAELEKDRARLIDLFNHIAAEERDGGDTCAYCGQHLPSDKVEELNARFEAELGKRLDAVESQGNAVAKELADKRAELSVAILAVKAAELRLNEASEQYTIAEQRARQTAKPEKTTIIPENITAWRDAAEQITEKLMQIDSLQDESDRLLQAIDEDALSLAMLRRDGIKAELSKRERIAERHKRIGELEAEGRKLAAEVAGYEREEFLLQSFVRDKVAAMDARINAMFSRVKWQLFDYTVDGNVQECCTALVNGIPYGAANTAGRLLAGFDIIRVLSNYYQVQAPIFIDNSEGLSELPEMANQTICMEVSRDEALRGTLEIINE